MVTRYRNHAPLHELEPHYSAHVSAMTAEKLHAKSEIAAELAARDKRIAELEEMLSAANCLIGESADEKSALDRRMQELEAALVPFADYADTWPATDEMFSDGKHYTDNYDFGARWKHGSGKEHHLKLGDYRRARRLLGREPERYVEEALAGAKP